MILTSPLIYRGELPFSFGVYLYAIRKTKKTGRFIHLNIFNHCDGITGHLRDMASIQPLCITYAKHSHRLNRPI